MLVPVLLLLLVIVPLVLLPVVVPVVVAAAAAAVARLGCFRRGWAYLLLTGLESWQERIKKPTNKRPLHRQLSSESERDKGAAMATQDKIGYTFRFVRVIFAQGPC